MQLQEFSNSQNDYGKCPEIAQFKVDAEKMRGTWRAYEVADEIKATWKCLHYEIIDETGQMKSFFVQEKFTGEKQSHVIRASAQITEIGNRLQIQWGDVTPKNATLIDVDYDDFATWYLCWPEHKDGGVTFVWTRKKHPTIETIQKAHDSIIKAGFKLTAPYLYLINHTGCFN